MLKGNVHVLAMQSSEPRVTGRFQAGMDVGYQADGSSVFGGQAYFELGTWQNQTNFTPTTGLWVMHYRGVGQGDNSDQITITGYGVGGSIDGWRTEATATRAAGAVFDPGIPYLVAGVLKSPPVTITTVIPLAGAGNWPHVSVGAHGSITTAGDQMTLRASWPGIRTVYVPDTTAWAGPALPWTVTAGHTLEARVDIVSVSDASVHPLFALYHADGRCYGLMRGPDHLALAKQDWSSLSFLSCVRGAARKTNEVLVLALTPSGNNVIVTARVLDRDNAEAVICETTVLDTPSSDPSLTAAQVTSITGIDLAGIMPDPAGAPWTSGTAPVLHVFQHTDGTLPAAEVTFAHFELRNYEIPPIGISRAVQVSWPCPAGVRYAVESAPTPQGQWLPVLIQAPPAMQQMTVPASDLMQFFRLSLAP
jgi:hypothetical protein